MGLEITDRQPLRAAPLASNDSCWLCGAGQETHTAEEKKILSESETIRDLWKHEKAMHGLAVLGLIGTMASGIALGLPKIAR